MTRINRGAAQAAKTRSIHNNYLTLPVLLMMVLMPLFGTAGFLLWDRLPRRFRQGLKPGMEIAVILPLLLLGAWVCLNIGPWVEAGVFGGDFRAWLHSAWSV